MTTGQVLSPTVWSAKAYQRSPKFFRVSHLRRLRGREQVAAVCYRFRKNRLEFLLVQTRGGRWTFPKGSAEPGLTTAQAAALEAFEEAGVHGRMEEASFARYVRQRRGKAGSVGEVTLVVTAHLCEVLRLEKPRESGRKPTWLSVGRAQRYLRKNRSRDYASELVNVIERATKCLANRILVDAY